MASVQEHYDTFLAPYYSWLSGGFALKVAENQTFFIERNILPETSRIAVDLGAGPGFQSIALAAAGFKVLAIDMNQQLLAELKDNAKDLAVTTVHDDLLNFASHSPTQNEVIVCMGDSLTHLQRLDDVRIVLNETFQALADNGRLVLAFRDLSRALTGLDRFIPVRSDAGRIFTCFVEYETDHVLVHDILYEKTGQEWQMKKSCFRKLRISPAWTQTMLEDIGFQIETAEIENGMCTLVARKP